MYTDRRPKRDARHLQRRYKDVLFLVGGICCVNLWNKSGARVWIDKVWDRQTIIFILIRRFTASMNTSNSSGKIGIRIIFFLKKMLSLKHTQTSYGTTNRFPECQKQTNGRKRLLSSTQGPWILFLVANLRRLIIRLHLQFQSWIIMFEQKLSKVTSLWKVILEYNLGSESNMSTELIPSGVALD